jgi:hypothetical protein
MSGFGGESSDMDLCLVISNHEVDQRFHALENLYRVQKALKQCRKFFIANLAPKISFKLQSVMYDNKVPSLNWM